MVAQTSEAHPLIPMLKRQEMMKSRERINQCIERRNKKDDNQWPQVLLWGPDKGFSFKQRENWGKGQEVWLIKYPDQGIVPPIITSVSPEGGLLNHSKGPRVS